MEGKEDEVLSDASPSGDMPKSEDQNADTKDNKEQDVEADDRQEEEDTGVKKGVKLEDMFDDDDDDEDDDEEFPDSDAVQIPE